MERSKQEMKRANDTERESKERQMIYILFDGKE